MQGYSVTVKDGTVSQPSLNSKRFTSSQLFDIAAQRREQEVRDNKHALQVAELSLLISSQVPKLSINEDEDGN